MRSQSISLFTISLFMIRKNKKNSDSYPRLFLRAYTRTIGCVWAWLSTYELMGNTSISRAYLNECRCGVKRTIFQPIFNRSVNSSDLTSLLCALFRVICSRSLLFSLTVVRHDVICGADLTSKKIRETLLSEQKWIPVLPIIGMGNTTRMP